MMNVGFSHIWFFLLGVGATCLMVGAFHQFAGNYGIFALGAIPIFISIFVSAMSYTP